MTPSPEEPVGLGAVVQDEGGTHWVRHAPGPLDLPWVRVPDMAQRRWSQMRVAEVRSEGWRP